MKRFNNLTNDERISLAIVAAEKILSTGSDLYLDIMLKTDWGYNSGSGADIVTRFYISDKVADVKLWSPWNRWTRAIGYFDGKAIHINTRKLPCMSHQDIVGNLCHEYSHLVGFSHGNNYKTQEKCEKSVPYWISEGISQGRWL